MNEETWSENRLWKYRVFVQTFVRSRSASASSLPPQPSHPSSPFLALTHLHDSKNHNSCILLSVSVWGNLSAACTQVLEPHWLCRRTISWYRCHFSFMSLLRRPFDLFYRPSYGRNSWQNCFMVIKKKKWVNVYFSNDLQNRGSKITFNHSAVHWRCQLTPGAVRMQEFSFSTSFISVKKGSWTCSWFKSTRLCHCFLSWRPSEGQQSMFLLYGRGCQSSRRSSVLTLQNFNGQNSSLPASAPCTGRSSCSPGMTNHIWEVTRRWSSAR